MSSGKSPRNADRKCHAWKGFCTKTSCSALLPALGKAKTGSSLCSLAPLGRGLQQGGCPEQKFWLVAVCSDPSYEIVMPLSDVPCGCPVTKWGLLLSRSRLLCFPNHKAFPCQACVFHDMTFRTFSHCLLVAWVWEWFVVAGWVGGQICFLFSLVKHMTSTRHAFGVSVFFLSFLSSFFWLFFLILSFAF